jgi:hypothetical protein
MNPMSQQPGFSTAPDPTTPGTCNVRINVNAAATVAVAVDGHNAKGERYFGFSEYPELGKSTAVVEATRALVFGNLARYHSAIAIDYSLRTVEHTGPCKYELWILSGPKWKKASEVTEPCELGRRDVVLVNG